MKITGRVKDLFKTSKGKYVAPAPIEDKLVMHAAVEACCVAGANLGQPLALVMLNAEAMQDAAAAGGRSALEQSLAEHLQEHQRHARPARAARMHRRHQRGLEVDNDLITPTFKVKRNRVDERFAAFYEAWERTRKKVIWHDA